MKETAEVQNTDCRITPVTIRRTEDENADIIYISMPHNTHIRYLREALTIYHMPLYKKLHYMVEDGSLGKLKMIQMNPAGEMAAAAFTLHAKQPKRGMIAFDKGYIEIYEYPRAEEAVITYTEDSRR